jgi:hypothetical protein
MDKIQKVVSNLSSKVDIRNHKTITIIIAAIIIIFAIIYVYQSRKTVEGFASYTVTGPNDTVLLGDLNKVRVGNINTNLMDAIISNSTFDTEVRKKISEKTSEGNFITNDDLNNSLTLYANNKDVNTTINTSLGNYLKKSDITTSNELDTLINRKINAYNTQAQNYVNAQVQQTIPNILQSLEGTQKLIGNVNINCRLVGDGFQNLVNNTFILGKKIIDDNVNLYNCPKAMFEIDATLTNYRFGNSNEWSITPRSHIICYFDWINDFNIFYIRSINSRIMSQAGGYNGYYSSVYPELNPVRNDRGVLQSPFPSTPIKANTKYFAKINANVYVTEGNYFMVYYILFNGTPGNPTYTVKYLSVIYSHNQYSTINKFSLDFAFTTAADTFNFGIYLVSCLGDTSQPNTSISTNWPNYSNVTIYELPTIDSIRPTLTTTPTTTRIA